MIQRLTSFNLERQKAIITCTVPLAGFLFLPDELYELLFAGGQRSGLEFRVLLVNFNRKNNSRKRVNCGRTTIFQGVDDQVPWLIWGSGNVDHLTVIVYPSGAAVCLADLFVDRSGVFEPQP